MASGAKHFRIFLKQMFTGCWVTQIIVGSLLPGNLPCAFFFFSLNVAFCSSLPCTKEVRYANNETIEEKFFTVRVVRC